MSLYLTIFDGEEEVAGWVLGHYSDFGAFRDKIAAVTDSTRYPLLMSHSDSDGEWSASELAALRHEIESVAEIFKRRPAEDLLDAFEHTREYREGAATLYECFHNVDGENLFEALISLCDEGRRRGLPILFQ
jgi:hypothetical protein